MPQLVSVSFPIIPQQTTQQKVAPVAFPRAPLFDFELGDFVTDSAGQIVFADGYTAWRQWCQKTIMTQQAAYPIYTRQYGVDYSTVLSNRPRAVVEADQTQRIRYALTRTVRTLDVVNFVFDWSVESQLQYSCTPVPAAGAPFVLPGAFSIVGL